MKTLAFGEERPNSGNMYLRVKEKGDFITFRMGQNPVYTGKHFQQTDSGWDVTSCPRINEGEKCELCEKFFSIKADEKKAKEVGDNNAKDLLSKEARKYAVSVIYYFPVLNRENEEFGILQTTEGVRKQINEQYNNGAKIFERDFVLRNTGGVGKDRYALTVVDSSESKPLSDKEKASLTKAREFDVTTINDGQNNVNEIADVDIPEDDEQVAAAKEIFGDEKEVKE